MYKKCVKKIIYKLYNIVFARIDGDSLHDCRLQWKVCNHW